eukprot:CAMPEP_0174260116 /NCGR_PEP_ID=MMETSP0439-20130205/8853_1 /TAXON_ID=0 /ORGANISM="Stereomyxa ramosa, Strain Chinc5" /LENGTH=409 /DNA_ID=CAMNT_0015344287 /DNA_START=124 /DNA_END=1353 /DNA_ORIENTATION=-
MPHCVVPSDWKFQDSSASNPSTQLVDKKLVKKQLAKRKRASAKIDKMQKSDAKKDAKKAKKRKKSDKQNHKKNSKKSRKRKRGVDSVVDDSPSSLPVSGLAPSSDAEAVGAVGVDTAEPPLAKKRKTDVGDGKNRKKLKKDKKSEDKKEKRKSKKLKKALSEDKKEKRKSKKIEASSEDKKEKRKNNKEDKDLREKKEKRKSKKIETPSEDKKEKRKSKKIAIAKKEDKKEKRKSKKLDKLRNKKQKKQFELKILDVDEECAKQRLRENKEGQKGYPNNRLEESNWKCVVSNSNWVIDSPQKNTTEEAKNQPEVTPSAATGGWNDWGQSEFEDADRKNKFLRLMGAAKSSNAPKKPGLFGSLRPTTKNTSNLGSDGIVNADALNKGLEGQFNEAMARRGQRTMGLGFEQ